jgi:60S ribosome subunit biogenesis protein NIP7
MRPLSEDETKIFFEKLSNYIGRNIKHLIDRPDEEFCFRLHKERVYYLSQALARRAAHAERDKLVHMGTCFGKFTKSLKFRLHVTCLDYLAQFAKYKVWVKPSSELSYLYGNNVLKAGLGRITENTPMYQVPSLDHFAPIHPDRMPTHQHACCVGVSPHSYTHVSSKTGRA